VDPASISGRFDGDTVVGRRGARDPNLGRGSGGGNVKIVTSRVATSRDVNPTNRGRQENRLGTV